MSKPRLGVALLSLSFLGLAACDAPDRQEAIDADGVLATWTEPGAALAMACSGCHSQISGGIVSLDGYAESDLFENLTRYKSESEGTTVMHRLARGYSDAEIAEISAYLGAAGSDK